MKEQELWQKFLEGGKIADYLEYKNSVNAQNKTELGKSGEDNCTGIGYKGTEYR